MRASTPIAALAAALVALSFNASAAVIDDATFNYRTTEDLYRICSVPDDPKKPVAPAFGCRAFIAATVQYHDAVSDRKKMKRLICYPQTATIADGRTAFLDWAGRNAGNTELMGERPVKGLVRALAEAFPCKK
jgi:hypothetical protein